MQMAQLTIGIIKHGLWLLSSRLQSLDPRRNKIRLQAQRVDEKEMQGKLAHALKKSLAYKIALLDVEDIGTAGDIRLIRV